MVEIHVLGRGESPAGRPSIKDLPFYGMWASRDDIGDGVSYVHALRGRSVASLNPRITVEPGKMSGKPRIRGLRFTVYDLASNLASGMTEEEILKDFPFLEKEDFLAAYEFFASLPDRSS